MTPLTLMGSTLELVNDAEAKWLQNEMDGILAIAWLAGYRIDLLHLGGKIDSKMKLQVLKFAFYHNQFSTTGYHRFTFDLVFNPKDTYDYCLFYCNDDEIKKEMPDDFAIIEGKRISFQGSIDPRGENSPHDMKTSALEYFKKYITNSIHAY
jgi:hypothetical protein